MLYATFPSNLQRKRQLRAHETRNLHPRNPNPTLLPLQFPRPRTKVSFRRLIFNILGQQKSSRPERAQGLPSRLRIRIAEGQNLAKMGRKRKKMRVWYLSDDQLSRYPHSFWSFTCNLGLLIHAVRAGA
ncbi:hypothetical protein BDP27DRAFT_901498 [Rhodocollybia butyracea]|uniref:Uncharacterized protein n=1 Tax=Rhodocollybia butyracea TaxID=206335 RepID=A0A9P5PPL7_9AGAR|nr:hypothetical protein BDP27DRAFT_901498 [Rhodocollybia butyracea]